MPTLKHLPYVDKYHLYTLMAQLAREKDAPHQMHYIVYVNNVNNDPNLEIIFTEVNIISDFHSF